MLQTLKNAWRTPEIKQKILFVLFILFLYRLGTVIPVPFVDAANFSRNFSGTIFSYMDTLSGGALSTATLFALGISPYITASIVIQLLCVAFPKKLGELGKTEEGKKKLNNITRFVTILLALVTAIGYYLLLANNGMVMTFATKDGAGNWTWFLYAATIVVCFCAGAALIMWLAEKINENGLGNGISLILFANIVAGTVSFFIRLGTVVSYSIKGQSATGDKWLYGSLAVLFAVAVVAIIVGLTIFVIFITGSERRIPVQYAKRVVGRKLMGGQNSTLPIKLNMTGVMPIIFASSIISIPPTIMTLMGTSQESGVYKFFAPTGWFYPTMEFLLIIFFAYFYINISFDPVEVANNLKKQGGTIPGIRQGRPTVDFIRKVLRRITLIGALFLGVIAILPIIGSPLVMQPIIKALIEDYYGSSVSSLAQTLAGTFTFGGTSLLIVVGVAQETFRELEAQLTMRNYKGFL
ncbi:MAG: preprotein translocase subunit SecY [Clostridia bacterium]|nr:preprotein translocase subunit SecY [Clostridia bacterium]